VSAVYLRQLATDVETWRAASAELRAFVAASDHAAAADGMPPGPPPGAVSRAFHRRDQALLSIAAFAELLCSEAGVLRAPSADVCTGKERGH
jgi:hypothetical protein